MKLVSKARLLAIAAAAVTAVSAQAAVNPDLSTWNCVGTCGSSGADGDVTLSPLGNTAFGFVTTDSTATGVSPLDLSETDSKGNVFGETTGSSITSAAFSAGAGEVLSTWYNFVSTDGKKYEDYAWARLVNAADNSTAAWLFTSRSSNSGTGNIVPGAVVDNKTFDVTSVITNYATYSFNERPLADSLGNPMTPVNWSPLGPDNGTCWDTNATGCGFTGWLNSQVTIGAAGSYKIEIGVTNFGDDLYHSGLAFDMAGLTAPVPEPGALPMLLSSLAVLGALARRRRQRG